MNDVPHMTPEEFRQRGYAMIDEVARYMERVGDYPVRSQMQPGEVKAKLPEFAPETSESWEAIHRDIESIILPGLTHWQSPNFFAYFSANVSGPSILGELLSAGFGVQGMLWATSPACTEVETRVLDWLVHMLGLPEHFLSASEGGGVLQDTASSATLAALLTARERASDWASNVAGVDRSFVAYASTQTHSSLEKAVMIAGIGRDNLSMRAVSASIRTNPGWLMSTAMSTSSKTGPASSAP